MTHAVSFRVAFSDTRTDVRHFICGLSHTFSGFLNDRSVTTSTSFGRRCLPGGQMKSVLKNAIKRIPILGSGATALWRMGDDVRGHLVQFRSSNYWESRYAKGGNSGDGSYGPFAEFKATVLNDFVLKNKIESVIEFGCGDGNQLLLAKYPRYVGVDVSQTALARCRELFRADPSKEFLTSSEYSSTSTKADVGLSLDVIYHLVEDDVYRQYMRALFAAAERFVIIYSDNKESEDEARHVRHRKFTDWIDSNERNWQLLERVANPLGSWSDFWIYQRK
jgi:SAM-dependent methyltransferase